MVIEAAKSFPNRIDAEETIDLATHMTGRNMTLQIEAIEQLCWCRLGAYHDEIPRSPQNRVKQMACRVATTIF